MRLCMSVCMYDGACEFGVVLVAVGVVLVRMLMVIRWSLGRACVLLIESNVLCMNLAHVFKFSYFV